MLDSDSADNRIRPPSMCMGDARIDFANANARTCRRATSRHEVLWRIRGLRDGEFLKDGGIADFTTVMGTYNACYFTAGTQMGQHGLFGSLFPLIRIKRTTKSKRTCTRAERGLRSREMA